MMAVQIILLLYLTYLSVLDIWKRKIPSGLLYAGVPAAFVAAPAGSVISGPLSESIRIVYVSLLGALPGLLMTVLSFYSDKVGRADGLVLMTVGVTESGTFAGILMCISCIILAAVSVCLMAVGRADKNTRMPYIPFVTAGYVMMKFFERGGFGI